MNLTKRLTQLEQVIKPLIKQESDEDFTTRYGMTREQAMAQHGDFPSFVYWVMKRNTGINDFANGRDPREVYMEMLGK